MVRCVKTWTELNGIPWGEVAAGPQAEAQWWDFQASKRARQWIKKEANSPLDLIILKRETAEWFIALTGTGRSGNPLIYLFGCEQGDEEGATQNPLGPEGQCAPSTTRHSSALGLNCTLGQSRAWHLGVRFRWGLCFMDTWGNDHLPREKHGGISSQKQRLMTTHSFSASK